MRAGDYLCSTLGLILLSALGLTACGGSSNDGQDSFMSGYQSSRSDLSTSSSSASITSSSQSSTSSNLVEPHPLAKTWQKNHYEEASNFKGLCEVPATGDNLLNSSAYFERQGTRLDEKFYIRSMVNDTYLWYDEVTDQNPNNFETVVNYYSVLKTNARTASGKLKDSYHFAIATEDALAMSSGSEVAAYGLNYAVGASDSRGVNVRIMYVDTNSPADIASVARGDRILAVNGVAIDELYTEAKIDAFVDALFYPTVGTRLNVTFERNDSSTYRVSITAGNVVPTVVDKVTSFEVNDKKVGYFVFHSFSSAAESKLYNAFKQLSVMGLDELVIDLRYNGGGYGTIASQLGYMVAGPENTANKIFQKVTFNNKHPLVDPFAGRAVVGQPFQSKTAGFSLVSGAPLPSLNLSRVFVITSENTCSASELLINGLRGAGIDVIQIGSGTCGKPYGFYAVENCGTTYYYVQFKAENHLGFGDYMDGFIPGTKDDGQSTLLGCAGEDDLDHALGARSERNLAQALGYIETGTCGAALSAGASAHGAAGVVKGTFESYRLQRHPLQRALIAE